MSFEEIKLGSICKIARGGSPRPINQFITNDTTGINWIKIGDTNKSSIYLTKTKEKIRPEGIKKSRRVYAGDLILSNSMSFGRPYILKIDGCIHDGWLLIRDNSNKFDKIFLCYLLGSPMVYAKFKNLAVGGVVNNLNSSMVRELTIPLPPLETQKQIVNLLDRAQALIDKRKEQIALMDQLIQSLFYDMFGDPVRNPRGWEKKILQENVVGKYGIKAGPFGSALKKVDYVTSGIRVYGQEQVIAGRFDIGDYYIDFNKFKKLKSCEVKQDDILVSLVGSFGKVLIVPDNIEKGIINPRLLKITLNQSVLVPRFFVEMFRLPMTQLSLAALSHGGTMGILNAGILKKMKTILPPISLQNTFAKRVRKIESQKEAMATSLRQLENNFNSIMQRAFKGEL